MQESTLKAKTSAGLLWGGGANLLRQFLAAAFGVYLARTLAPSDYGLMGMLAIFSVTATVLQEGSFNVALVNRKQTLASDYNSVFWFNILVSLLCYAVLFACAPLIARFFGQPELVRLSRWVFLSFVIASFGCAQRAYLTKALMVKQISIVNTAAIFISGSVGVVLASMGFGYWTLVAQGLISNTINVAGYWLSSPWRPSLRIDFGPVGEMMRFSVRMVITSLASILGSNLLSVILGRHYDAVRVGYYTQANKWSTMGTSVLTGMMGGVAHPVLASVAGERERHLRIFRRLVRFTAMVSFPAMLGLAFIVPEFIPLLLTEKWNESVPLLRILCVGGAFVPICSVCSSLILSIGNSRQYMWATVGLLVAVIGITLACLPLGVSAMVAGVTAANILWLLVWWALLRRDIGYRLRQLAEDVLPFLLVAAGCIAVAMLLTHPIANRWLLLAAKIIITAALWAGAMTLSKSVTFREGVDYILRRQRNQS